MRAKVGVLLLALTPLAPVASVNVYISSAACNFTFSNGDVPNFQLPEAGPNSPGDVQLNEGNPIVPSWGESNVTSGCNGDSGAYYAGNDTWNTSFIGNDGLEYDIDVFYATYQEQLWVRTLQPHMDPSLYEVLNNTKIRLNITCSGDTNSCLEFTTNFTDATPYNYTAPLEFTDTCYHGFSTGELTRFVTVPAASPVGPTTSSTLGFNKSIILAGKADQGLPWSEGFDDAGNEKDDKFWGDWWDTTHRRYGGLNTDDDSDDDSDSDSDEDESNRRLRHLRASSTASSSGLDPESDCTGGVSEFWDPTSGVWKSVFETIDGEHPIDMFYMQEADGVNELWVTEIESWMAPSLYNQLQYNYVKLGLTCPYSTQVDSCVIFMPTFVNWSPDVDGDDASFRFSDPAIPSFDIPEAFPNSPGEVLLTSGNTIVSKAGSQTETYCNGDDAEYYGEDGYWYNEFIRADGETYELSHVFYPYTRNLYAATIQSNWEPNLSGLLVGRTIRIRVWCTNDERAGYLLFRVSGEESTCDDIPDLCKDNEDSGDSVRLAPTRFQCAATLSATALGWLFATSAMNTLPVSSKRLFE